VGNEPPVAFPGILRPLIRLLQIILYVMIQIVFIPVAIVGLIAALFKEMGNCKRLGVSFTAVQSLQYRWIMHQFNTRPDPFSVAFIKNFPCESHFGLWATLGPLIISQRLFGFTTKFGRLDEPGRETLVSTPGRRVLMFDQIMKKHLDDVEQIVIPGAGFDLIALHFTDENNVKVFELDQADTLNIKVKTLKQAGIRHDWITYVPVDYSCESWVDKLLDAGFDKSGRTLFLWQSVSLFLDADVAKETLTAMAELCGDGSLVAQDLYSKAFIRGEISKTAKRSEKMMAKMGEPWKFGLDMSEDPESAVESFLSDCGLKMTDYFQFGKALGAEPFYCIVEAERLRS
jgi:methyltransferase (TIGR00027 family)